MLALMALLLGSAIAVAAPSATAAARTPAADHDGHGHHSRPPPPAAKLPSDWASRVASGQMIFNPNCAMPSRDARVSSVWGDHAPVANGYLGSYVDSGTLYIAGTFTGLADLAGMNAPGGNTSNGKLQRSHLAR